MRTADFVRLSSLHAGATPGTEPPVRGWHLTGLALVPGEAAWVALGGSCPGRPGAFEHTGRRGPGRGTRGTTSLAVKAAAGQKEIPNQGTATDINIASTLLPYCDAMFVDNKCRALLQDIPKEYALPYPCKVFSLKTGADFIQYLTGIRDSVTANHLALIKEVYGPDPMKVHKAASMVLENKSVEIRGISARRCGGNVTRLTGGSCGVRQRFYAGCNRFMVRSARPIP